MATIEQARADRARETLNRSVNQQQIEQQDVQTETARADVARAVVAKGDGIEGKESTLGVLGSSVAAGDDGIAHMASGANPFSTLVATGDSAPVNAAILLGEALPLGTELAPGVDQLIRLSGLQSSAFKQSASGLQATADKVRVGTMLLMSDDGALAHEKLGDMQGNAEALSSSLLGHATGDSKKPIGNVVSEHVMSSDVPANMDVNAYVEAVLREAYMIQQGVLLDFGQQMDEMNKHKKEIRARMAKLRDLKTKAAQGKVSYQDLADAGVTLSPGDVDDLGGPDFNWPQQGALDDLENQLDVLQGKDPSHHSAGAVTGAGGSGGDTADDSPNGTPIPVSYTKAAGLFSRTVLNSSVADTWTQTIYNIGDQYGHGLNQAEDAFVYYNVGGDKGDNSPIDQTTMLTAVAQNVGTLSGDQLNQFMTTLVFSATSNAKDDNHSAVTKPLLATAIEHMTLPQLEQLRGNSQLWASINNATGGAAEARDAKLNGLSNATDATVTPGAQGAFDAYLVAEANGFDSQSCAVVQAALYGMSGDDERSFLSGVSKEGNCPSNTFGQFVTACNPKSLLTGADPSTLAYFKTIGGAAAAIYSAWTGTGATQLEKDASVGQRTQVSTVSTANQPLGQQSTQAQQLAKMFKQTGGAETAAAPTSSTNAGSVSVSATTSASAGTVKPIDSANSATAAQIMTLQGEIQQLMAQKLDDLASDPNHAKDVETFFSSKVGDALDNAQDDLDNASGDAEMMQLQLQDAMQKSQELMQMMSNMSKVIHDTVMSVIRNIGG